MTDHYCYCYCVAETGFTLNLKEVGSVPGGPPPHAVQVGGLQAVVSSVPVAEYSEESLRGNFQRMHWVEAAVLSHERVVEGCLRQTEVVPMKFCTLFRSEGDLATALTQRQGELVSKLLDLKDRQEWGIRLAADRERLREQLLRSDPEVASLQRGAAAGSPGVAHFFKKRLEDRLMRSMEQALADAAEDAHTRLASAATRSALLNPSGARAVGEEPVLNAAFLVTDEQLANLLDLAARIVAERPWLKCQPSGPWPPYNFV